MAQVVLVTPLHDPDARLDKDLIENGKKLKEIYNNNVFVSVTSSTSEKIVSLLTQLEVNFQILSEELSKSLGTNYRKAIEMGIKENNFVHLLDFDRALHWTKRFPEELTKIKADLEDMRGFVCFARSRRAFESHPLTQRSTETTINAIASEFAGLDVDIMSGSFGFDYKLAENIIKQSKRNDFGFYAEILQIAVENKFELNRIEVEGLEWETPDQYKDVIDKLGYTKWLNDFESLPEWEKRVKLIEKSTEVLINKADLE